MDSKDNKEDKTRHPAPGCENFGRDILRGSIFVIMTILRGTILAQGHHHFPNSPKSMPDSFELFWLFIHPCAHILLNNDLVSLPLINLAQVKG